MVVGPWIDRPPATVEIVERATEYLWMRHEFPWLGTGFIHAVADDFAQQLAGDLDSRGCRIISLRGEEMTTPGSFWNEIKPAFEFPDYFRSCWDEASGL